MVCIYCGSATRVINSRLQKRVNHVWRRRSCPNCKAVFTSIEAADLASSLSFATSHNEAQPFSRDRLFISLYDSLRHRPSAFDDATALTATILSKVTPRAKSAVVPRALLIQTTIETLKHFDKAAYVSYAAFHRPKPT